jgi:hypothetical protein
LGRDGDDAEAGVRDVLTMVQVERALRVVEDAEETNDAERKENDAADG